MKAGHLVLASNFLVKRQGVNPVQLAKIREKLYCQLKHKMWFHEFFKSNKLEKTRDSRVVNTLVHDVNCDLTNFAKVDFEDLQ